MAKLADGLPHQRRGADLLAGRLDTGRLGERGAGQAVEASRTSRGCARQATG